MKNRKLERFFVEPRNPFTDQALRQSDCLADKPDKIIRKSDGVHRLLQCCDKRATQFLKGTHSDDDRFRMAFWVQVGHEIKKCHIRSLDFSLPVSRAA